MRVFDRCAHTDFIFFVDVNVIVCVRVNAGEERQFVRLVRSLALVRMGGGWETFMQVAERRFEGTMPPAAAAVRRASTTAGGAIGASSAAAAKAL